jgi:prepilin-type N-terminal cleavage/methylation domain-containing protein
MKKVKTKHSLSAGVKGRVCGGSGNGFTMVEIVIVVVILSFAAMLAIPMMSGAASMQLRSAANMAAGDLEYVKSLAISRGESFSVEFDASAESYRIVDANGAVMTHPVRAGQDYTVQFAGQSRLNRVNIASVDFNGTSKVTFDYLGSPHDGSGNPLNTGEVTLQADSATITISVEPVTGFISISE